MTRPSGTEMLLQPSTIEELIRTLVKALRAYQIYLPNNPIYQRAQQSVQAAFPPVWEVLDELVLVVSETDFVWEEITVYHQPSRHESLAWTLYKDGMRILVLKRGCEESEITRFLEVVQAVRSLPAEADDDLNTLLWSQDFQYINYRFTDLGTDGAPAEMAPPAEAAQAAGPGDLQGRASEEVAEAKSGSVEQGRSGIVDLEDFDSTLYFLDEREIEYLNAELQREYTRDLRTATLDVLFDLIEIQSDGAIRDEIIGILEVLVPSLLNAAEFRHVAGALRELRTVAERGRDFSDAQRARLDAFRARLSDPEVLNQLLQSVDEATTAPDPGDLGELFGELRPAALETILVWAPRVRNPAVRDLLVSASERLAEAAPGEVMRLLRTPESEALGAVIELCGRLRLQGAVAGLGETMASPDREIRLGAARALTDIGSPGALAQLEKGLEDADREVRIQCVRTIGARGYRSALPRLEEAVAGRGLKDADITERLAFFEAFAMVAGAAALEPLTDLLVPGGMFRRKETSETRACAALALGKLRNAQAREVLERMREDKDLVVRNAVLRALREAAA